MSQKQQSRESFNLSRALYMADSYMRMADREITELQGFIESEFNKKKAGPICIIISSLAFSLEIYFKSILFCIDEQPRKGHDLRTLWNDLPSEIKTWVTEKFDSNYSSNRGWCIMALINPSLRGIEGQGKVKIPALTATGMIEGHRLAFKIARYGYELPPAPKLKAIIYNIEGLQILSWLTRTIAYNIFGQLQEAKEANEGEKGPLSVEITFPDGPIEKFPSDKIE